MGSTKRRATRSPKKMNNDAGSSISPTVIIAIIGLIGTLGAAYISYLRKKSEVELPINATRTANALQAAIAMTTQAYLPGLTDTAPAPAITETFTPISISTSIPSPTLTVEDQLIQLVDNYYICINTANPGLDSDYEKCWNLLSDRPGETQSNLNKNSFKASWKKYKVTYALYYCSKGLQNFVDAKYYLYNRNDLSVPIGNGTVYYLEYSFGLDQNGWRIKKMDNTIRSVGSYCESQPRMEKLTLFP